MRAALRALALAASLGFGPVVPFTPFAPFAAAQTEVPTAVLLDGALSALDAGDAGLAAEVAGLITAQDPANVPALLTRARAELSLGQQKAARETARQAWRVSRDTGLRYAAARIAARASIELREAGPSKRWVSRALALAPTEAAAQQLRADYAAIRAAAPVSADFSFSFAPSSNVNGGASTSRQVIDGVPVVGTLSPAAQALSGYEARLDYALSVRLRESERRRLSFTFDLTAREVWLSSEAQQQAPTLSNADLAYRRAALGLRREWLSGEATPLRWRGELSGGTIHAGGDFTDDLLRGAISAQSRRFSYGLALERRFARDPRDVDEDHRTLSLRHVRPVALGQLQAGAALRDVKTTNVQTALRALSVDAALSLGEPVGPFALTVFGGLSRTEYPDYIAGFFRVPGGREDTRAVLGLEAALPDIFISGFNPVLSLSADRTWSNVSRFDTERFGLGFALRRAF